MYIRLLNIEGKGNTENDIGNQVRIESHGPKSNFIVVNLDDKQITVLTDPEEGDKGVYGVDPKVVAVYPNKSFLTVCSGEKGAQACVFIEDASMPLLAEGFVEGAIPFIKARTHPQEA